METGRTGSDARAEVTRMLEGGPDEDDPGVPGEGNLLAGGVELVRLVDTASTRSRKAAVGQVEAIASYAYQALMDLAIPDASGGEAEVAKAEQGSEACREEIAFQGTYLAALESLGQTQPLLATVLSEMRELAATPAARAQAAVAPKVRDPSTAK